MSLMPAASSGWKSDAYDVDFFDAQLRFAKTVAELSGRSLAETVGSHTNIYVRLAMGPRLDVSNVEWRNYLAGLMAALDPAAWTLAVHLRRRHLHAGPTPAMTEGCFSYELVAADRARLHFHVAGFDSPLSAESQSQRFRDLAALFAHLKVSTNDSLQIVGASWLYNLSCYRRLFPKRYLASLQALKEHPYQRMPLWGQLLTRDRTIRAGAGARFRADVANASSLTELAACFPLPVLATMAPAKWFYDHLGL